MADGKKIKTFKMGDFKTLIITTEKENKYPTAEELVRDAK
jgi:hypothetical protein